METKRTEHATQNDVHPDYERDAKAGAATVEPVSMSPVPVTVGHPVATYQQSAPFGISTTYVIQPGSANAILILPLDPCRLRAVFQVNQSNVVLCNSQSAAQAPGNIAGVSTHLPPTPAGFVVALNTSPAPFESQSELWCVNSDPTLVAYVSVEIERTNP
jgi:hypothetical protein